MSEQNFEILILQIPYQEVPLYEGLSNKTVSETSKFHNNHINYISEIQLPALDTSTGTQPQVFDTNMLTYQMESGGTILLSHINGTSGNNNVLSTVKHKNFLDDGSSLVNSNSDNSNLSTSTSYLNSSFLTSASKTLQNLGDLNNSSVASGSHILQNQSGEKKNLHNNQNQKSKKKRGRPPLEHGTPPSHDQLKDVDPVKRKYLEERYKNNEASRMSRRNRNRREKDEKEEEQREIKRNLILKAKHDKLTKRHEFLKEYLRSLVVHHFN